MTPTPASRASRPDANGADILPTTPAPSVANAENVVVFAQGGVRITIYDYSAATPHEDILS